MKTTQLLVNGNAAVIPLPDDSIHCVITSIPYWGLRDYGLPPLVWEHQDTVEYRRETGDKSELCQHVWGSELLDYKRGQVGTNSTLVGGLQVGGDGRIQIARQGSYCQECGAWRGCLGLEPSPDLYVSHVVQVFREVRRVMRADATCWLNIGDSYSQGGGKQVLQTKNASHGLEGLRAQTPDLASKQLLMIPARVALALQADGWWVRSEIIWHKPNPMPGSMTDRPTTAHEKVFLLSKAAHYFYDAEAIREESSNPNTKPRPFGGMSENRKNHDRHDYMYQGDNGSRNKRTVWTIPTQPFKGSHFATFPPALVEPMIKAGTSERGVCPECGGPWERIKEPSPEYAEHLGKDWADYEQDETDGRGHFALPDGTKVGQRPVKRNAPSLSADYITTGWRPTCDHDHEPIPATVLDPFVGSGTTLLEARRLGRRGIGLDLSFTYLHDQARERLGFTALAEWKTGKDGTGESLDTLPLFKEV